MFLIPPGARHVIIQEHEASPHFLGKWQLSSQLFGQQMMHAHLFTHRPISFVLCYIMITFRLVGFQLPQHKCVLSIVRSINSDNAITVNNAIICSVRAYLIIHTYIFFFLKRTIKIDEWTVTNVLMRLSVVALIWVFSLGFTIAFMELIHLFNCWNFTQAKRKLYFWLLDFFFSSYNYFKQRKISIVNSL